MYRASIGVEWYSEDKESSTTTKWDYKLDAEMLGPAIEEAAKEARARAMSGPHWQEVKNVSLYVYPYDK